MRALLQRVARAEVRLPDGERRATGRGLLLYLGVGRGDDAGAARKLCEKALGLRVFPNAEGKFDRSVLDERGEILLISQFTLYGDLKGGRRPDFTAAASPADARALYDLFSELLRAAGLVVKTGEFGASMAVESVNEGPVNLWLDTDRF